MAPTLASLLRHDAVDVTVRVGDELLERPITWVHVSELPDPTPYLEGGELLLTLGLQLGGDHGGLRAYVERLGDRGVGALGVGIGFGFPTIPTVLLDTAQRCGLPVLEVPRPVPFIAVAKAFHAELVEEENETAAAVFRSQRRLVRASSDPHDPGDGAIAIVSQLAREMSGWVVLADPDGAPVHATGLPAGAEVEFTAAVDRLRGRGTHSSASFGAGDATVVAQALGAHSTPRGYLVVGANHPARASDTSVVNVAASLLTIILEHARARDDERHELAGHVYDLARSHGIEAAGALATQLRWQPPAGPIRVAVIDGPELELAEVSVALRRLSDRILVGRPSGLPDPRLAILAPADVDVAGRLAPVLAEHPDCVAGISRENAPGDVAGAEREAVTAMLRGRDGGGQVVDFADLAHRGLFAMLGPSSNDVAAGLLAPLIEYDERRGGAMVETVRTWLEHHGQWQPSADVLGIHRHTLRYRVETAERLLDRSLDSARARMELLLAFEVWDHRRQDGRIPT